MTSFDNIGSTDTETWAFRPTFETSWFSDHFDRDAELFTKALTQSITHASGSTHKHLSTFSETTSSLPVHSVSTSGGSEPEPETPSVSKRPPRNPLSVKSAKRKSRASKRSPTTFITADPANFRAMVQKVTGARFNPSAGPILKPEPLRAGLGSGTVTRLQGGGGYLLPTLDTSAFLLGHHQQIVGPSSGGGGTQGFGGPNVGEVGGTGFDFDGFSCFPTLESGKVM